MGACSLLPLYPMLLKDFVVRRRCKSRWRVLPAYRSLETLLGLALVYLVKSKYQHVCNASTWTPHDRRHSSISMIHMCAREKTQSPRCGVPSAALPPVLCSRCTRSCDIVSLCIINLVYPPTCMHAPVSPCFKLTMYSPISVIGKLTHI